MPIPFPRRNYVLSIRRQREEIVKIKQEMEKNFSNINETKKLIEVLKIEIAKAKSEIFKYRSPKQASIFLNHRELPHKHFLTHMEENLLYTETLLLPGMKHMKSILKKKLKYAREQIRLLRSTMPP